MDDEIIQGQLRQIFPQVDSTFIQRTIEEAKSNQNEVVDILTLCIQIILDWQALQAGRITENTNNGREENDDVVIVKSVKKEHLNNARTREIPVVYVGEDKPRLLTPPTGDFEPNTDNDSDASEDEGTDFFNFQQTVAPNLPSMSQFSAFNNHQVLTSTQNANPPVPNHFVSEMPSTSTMSTATSLLSFVTQMFPKVNKDFVQNLSQQGYDLNAIVNILLDRPDMQNYCSSEPQPSTKEPTQAKNIDYFKDYSQNVSPKYFEQCLNLLKNEFRRVAVNDIRKAMRMCNKHYAPTRKLIEEALLAMNQTQPTYQSPQSSTSLSTSSMAKSQKFTITRLISNKRPLVYVHPVVDDELKHEIDFVKEQAMLNEEKKNAIYAAHLNELQYKDEGQLIECGCCFGEFPFEEIVQCSDGHLFCKECLHGYAKEIIFGSSIASVELTCMGEDCKEPFPYNQLEKCLTVDEIEKYRGRLLEDCLAKVDIPNLHSCPFCEFAAIVPEREKVFACMNPKCGKESCKECKEEWKDHFGLKCSEVEKKSETNLRVSYEERMTMAKVRKCSKCSLCFTKQDGCNKMTCRCGTTQCYICRKPSITYDHFCRHPRDPGKKCTKCTTCSLWTDPTEDDNLAIQQLQQEAVVAKRKLNEEIELKVKRQKV